MLAVQPVVPGLVPCAATPGRQPAAVLFTGSRPRVKGGEKVYRWGVEVQGKGPVKCSAKMSLG